MSDIASLGIAVDSSQAAEGAVDLDKLTAAAKTADVATERLGQTSIGMSSAMSRMITILESIERDLTVVTRAFVAEGAAADTATAAIVRSNAAHMSSGQAMANSRNLMFQMVDIGQGIPLMFQNAGYGALNFANQLSQIGQSYYGQGGMRAALGDMADMLGGVLTKAGPLIGILALLGIGFAGMTTEINKNQAVQVSWLGVIKATFEVAWDSFQRFAQPVVSWFSKLWSSISPYVSDTMIGMIKMFDLGFRDIKTIFSALPAALGDIMIQTVNNVIKGINDMIAQAVAGLTSFMNDPTVMFLLGAAGMHDVPKIKAPELPQVPNPFAGSGKSMTDQFSSNLKEVNSTDYLGMIGDRAAADQIAAQTKATDAFGKSLKGANDNAKLLHAGLKDVGGVTDMVAASQRAFADTALTAFGRLTGGLAELFKNNKAFAVANAVVSTAEGIAKAWGQGGVFGFIGAAGVAAAGAAQIASILSAQPGSSSSASVSGGGAAANAQSTAAAPAQGTSINLTIRGSGNVNVDALADQLAKSIADGGNQSLVKVIRAA